MNWFNKFWKSIEPVEDDHDGGPLPSENGDWVVLPWRLAEGARLSMYTVAAHPDLPPHVKWWIVNWLNTYNSSLVNYFTENYGPDVFDVLETITQGVKDASEEYYSHQAETMTQAQFERWESELNGQPSSDDPPPTG